MVSTITEICQSVNIERCAYGSWIKGFNAHNNALHLRPILSFIAIKKGKYVLEIQTLQEFNL